MNKIFVLLALTISFSTSFAQRSNNFSSDLETVMIDFDERASAFGLSNSEYEAIKEQVYENPTFLPGSIFKDDQLAKKDVYMRYNTNADVIETRSFYDAEDNYTTLTKNSSISAKIANETYVFVPFEGSNEKGGYFKVVTIGKTYDLYQKTTATFIPLVFAKTSYDKDRPASFTKSATYYLVDKGGNFYQLPKSERKLLDVMSAKKAEMKSYIKKNKLDVDKQSDLGKIVDHFNELL